MHRRGGAQRLRGLCYGCQLRHCQPVTGVCNSLSCILPVCSKFHLRRENYHKQHFLLMCTNWLLPQSTHCCQMTLYVACRFFVPSAWRLGMLSEDRNEQGIASVMQMSLSE